MSLFRFLGLGEESEKNRDVGDTESVRRIASNLERLDPNRAKFLAAFAYVLARVANADLEIDPTETKEMENSLAAISDLSRSEIALVVEIAKSQARLLGGTENYVVTREFRKISTPEAARADVAVHLRSRRRRRNDLQHREFRDRRHRRRTRDSRARKPTP